MHSILCARRLFRSSRRPPTSGRLVTKERFRIPRHTPFIDGSLILHGLLKSLPNRIINMMVPQQCHAPFADGSVPSAASLIARLSQSSYGSLYVRWLRGHYPSTLSANQEKGSLPRHFPPAYHKWRRRVPYPLLTTRLLTGWFHPHGIFYFPWSRCPDIFLSMPCLPPSAHSCPTRPSFLPLLL